MIVTIIEIAGHLCVFLGAGEVKTVYAIVPREHVGRAHSGRMLQWAPAAIDDVRKVNGILFTARITSKGLRAPGLINRQTE